MSIEISNVYLKFRKYTSGATHLKTYISELLRSSGVRYVDFFALSSLTLSINTGDRLGIVGLNGAGKSTLLKLIAGIYSPSSGRLLVDGKIAPLLEIGSGFHPELTGRENVRLNCALLGLGKKATLAKESEIFQFAELEHVADQQVKYYSTGMNLRLGFSICAVVEPDILIIDEFFAGGDHHFIEKSRAKLIQLISSARILIMVSHDLAYIREFCNRVIWLDAGRVKADGGVDEVLGLYENS